MSDERSTVYDVAVIGGGPAGSTLATLLARLTKLKVAVFESEFFPREHIGESLTHRCIPILEQSGALAKVMASECWEMKPGAYFVWGDTPFASVFERETAMRDGVPRWSVHVNRSEFDDILLRHAESCGVEVFEGTAVTAVHKDKGVHRLELGDGTTARCRFVVDATGRSTSVVTSTPKAYLSKYKNIAIWNHFVGGKHSLSVAGDWAKVYVRPEWPPIGNFAFEDGWFWYIPIRKMVQGKRVHTHSIGMVTDPRVLRDSSKRYTDMRCFVECAKSVPMLRDLIADAQPISDKVLTATNYSMISDKFSSLEERWILIGDAAYFVDPLFSSGITFALNHAASAAVLLQCTLEETIPVDQLKELWLDYESGWQATSRAFALGIDQWYHAIAEGHPTSVYWKFRSTEQMFPTSERPFQALVDSGLPPGFLRVVSRGGTTLEALGGEGPLPEALESTKRAFPPREARISMAPNVGIRESLTLDINAYKAFQRSQGASKEALIEPDKQVAEYWKDPLKNAHLIPPICAKPRTCYRFYFEDGSSDAEVRFDEDTHKGRHLFEKLRTPMVHAEVRSALSYHETALLDRLMVAKMVVASD